ncbi:MAG: hypothetical protein JRI68_17415 [Deltaproteobacteria bacterium]|nr:hypothetical protein [Deltaproteobacteria bacterium]
MMLPIRRLSLIAVAAACGCSTAGCATVQRATLEHLQYRATFDLGCPGGQLWLYHIDSRTKAVAGCGQRLVYLEQCDSVAGACSWKIDTPMLVHAQGQRPYGVRPPHGVPIPGQGTSANSAPNEPRGRTIRTELYGEDKARTAPKPPEPRQTPTVLFGGTPGTPGKTAAPPAAPTAPPPAGRPPGKGTPARKTQPLPPSTATPPPPGTPYDFGF